MCNDLTELVRDSGWTQTALAEELGVHHTTIGRALRKPTRRELLRARIAELIKRPPPHSTNEAAT